MDITKHWSVFDPSKLGRGKIAIAGVGALGSALAIQLAKLGNENMVLFDHDEVEAHNLPNQILYGPDDIGSDKVTAARDAILRLTGYKPSIRNEKLEGKYQLEGVTNLFVCVDSMAARKAIFNSCVFLNPQLDYFCEGRMNAREGTLYGFEPTDLSKAKEYRLHHLYDDSDVPEDRGTCGNVLSIGATAMTLACQMTWHFINFHAEKDHGKQANEISFSVNDLAVHSKVKIGASKVAALWLKR